MGSKHTERFWGKFKQTAKKIWRWVGKNGGIVNVIIAFALLVVGICQFDITRNQFKFTLSESKGLGKRLGKLDTTLLKVGSSAKSLDTTISRLDTTMVEFKVGMDTTLGLFKKEMILTMTFLNEYTQKSYNQLMASQNIQKEVLQSLKKRQEIIQRETERMPLIVVVANDVKMDSQASINFRFCNYGDKSTRDVAVCVRVDDIQRSKYRVAQATGEVYVPADSQIFWLYYRDNIYRGVPDEPYNVAGDQRVILKPINGDLDSIIKLIAVIYTSERQAYNQSFLVERTNSRSWFKNAYLLKELDKINARQADLE